MSVIYLAGLDLMPAHDRWRFSVAEGIDDVPEVRGSSLVVPFRAGRVWRSRTPDKRRIALNGYVRDADLRAAVDEVKSVLSPADTSQPLLVEDPLGYADPRWTNVVIANVIAQVRSRILRTYSIELEADPFWYGIWGDLSTLDEGLALDEGYLLDLSTPLVVTPTTTNELVSIVDLGTYWTERIVVRMTGPSTSAVGLHTDDTSIGFVMAAALAAGEELVVDAYARTVTLDGVNARGEMTLLSANEHGEYLRFARTAQDVRIVGQPASCSLQFSKTFL